MPEVARFRNGLNIYRGKLTVVKQDFLMAVISEVQEKRSTLVEIPYWRFREITGHTYRLGAIEDLIDELHAELLSIPGKYKDNLDYISYAPFHKLKYNYRNKSIAVSVDELAVDYFNDFDDQDLNRNKPYTEIILDEQVRGLKTKASKNLYWLLKQWRTRGGRDFRIEEIRETLNVTHNLKPYDLKRDYIVPSLIDLEPYFKNLEFAAKKNPVGSQGLPQITHFCIRFDQEDSLAKSEKRRERNHIKRMDMIDKYNQLDWVRADELSPTRTR